MKKSLFSKLMSTYFIIIVISYILVSVFLSIWFYKYYYEEKKSNLLNEANHIKSLVIDCANREINRTDMQLQLLVIERLLNCEITVFDSYGYEIGKPLDYPESKNNISSKISKKDLLTVMDGKEIIKTGDFEDVFNSDVLTVGLPVKISDNVSYSVFMHSPFDEVERTIINVFCVIWVVAFFAIMISAFIVYYFSEKILIIPLSNINNTAKQIAKGEFNNRVDIVSNDEIGDLAVSFNYMADSLEDLENMRRSFIANVSHELRSPMTSINGFVEGMIDGTIPIEKWERYLKVVDGESKRLIRIINDLLDLARLESGEFSMRMGSFELNEFISDSIIKFEDRIYQKNINMNVILMKNGVTVKGDKDRLNQVLTNLVDNAIKFVPEGGTIEVSAVRREDRILVSVFNTGEPIPKEDIKYIWERFHKVDKARVRSGGGVGLGLSIARQILNQHNQTIWVESDPSGNTFRFTLGVLK
ncbi:sensor histidine kinase [Clostridium cylindrosporum]|uniref:histidine kinase n=1 Tax=Clostridium cylindrosporum DSM 605 TaxID=1121307 RepID=A0A0J8G2Y4_CLOCY|nr:HAMP domain-containing sensor histidine kinase [Clostridium cylindrosporum]KMT22061.1 sensor histidine kinase YclK [Clostridium cylindrosporum DSM 605]